MIMNASSCQYAIILENNAFDGINVTEIKKKNLNMANTCYNINL